MKLIAANDIDACGCCLSMKDTPRGRANAKLPGGNRILRPRFGPLSSWRERGRARVITLVPVEDRGNSEEVGVKMRASVPDRPGVERLVPKYKHRQFGTE